jgi:hypothetical protein
MVVDARVLRTGCSPDERPGRPGGVSVPPPPTPPIFTVNFGRDVDRCRCRFPFTASIKNAGHADGRPVQPGIIANGSGGCHPGAPPDQRPRPGPAEQISRVPLTRTSGFRRCEEVRNRAPGGRGRSAIVGLSPRTTSGRGGGRPRRRATRRSRWHRRTVDQRRGQANRSGDRPRRDDSAELGGRVLRRDVHPPRSIGAQPEERMAGHGVQVDAHGRRAHRPVRTATGPLTG